MLRRLISLILGFLLLAAAAADFAAGMSAYQRGDFEAAVAEWRPLAEQVDAKSQEMIGFMYLQGQGVPRGDLLAVQWYRRAAEQGHAGSQNSLGVLYESGRGTPKDYATAAEWYRRAAEQGYVDAKNNLGRAYMEGRGVPANYPEARRLFSEAAAEGWGQAMINLGRMHQLGRGMKVDLEEASRWYVRAADAGLTGRARTHLVEAAKRGSDAAATWLHDTANSGDPAVQRELGLMYSSGVGTLQDFVRAHLWLNLAAALGNANAAADRTRVEDRMSTAELQEARDRAAAWWEAYQNKR